MRERGGRGLEEGQTSRIRHNDGVTNSRQTEKDR